MSRPARICSAARCGPVIRWMLVTEETRRRLHAAEFSDDDLVVLIAGLSLPSQAARFRMGSSLAAQIEGAEHRGVMLAGHAGHAGQADDLQHFGDIDAVVPAVGAAVGLLFLNEKFYDFELIIIDVEQAVLGHGIPRPWLKRRQ